MPRLRDAERLIGSLAYPGMPADEGEVARAWIRRHVDDYDRLEFNVRIGPANKIPEGMSESTERLNSAVGRRRADIIAWHGSSVDIVEVKTRVTLSAMGQLKGYRALWSYDHPVFQVDKLIAVGTLAVEGVAIAMEAEHIQLEVLPEEEVAHAAI